jgi:hypothetical protein
MFVERIVRIDAPRDCTPPRTRTDTVVLISSSSATVSPVSFLRTLMVRRAYAGKIAIRVLIVAIRVLEIAIRVLEIALRVLEIAMRVLMVALGCKPMVRSGRTGHRQGRRVG